MSSETSKRQVRHTVGVSSTTDRRSHPPPYAMQTAPGNLRTSLLNINAKPFVPRAVATQSHAPSKDEQIEVKPSLGAFGLCDAENARRSIPRVTGVLVKASPDTAGGGTWCVKHGSLLFPIEFGTLPPCPNEGVVVAFAPKFDADGPTAVRVIFSLARADTAFPNAHGPRDAQRRIMATHHAGYPSSFRPPTQSAHAAEVLQVPQQALDRLRTQVEYYLSPEVLQTDAFMQSKMDHNGAVPFAVIMTCNKIKAITNDVAVLVRALEASTFLEVNTVCGTVRPKLPVPTLAEDTTVKWAQKAKELDDRMQEKHAGYLIQKERNREEAVERRAAYLTKREWNHTQAAAKRAAFLARRARNHEEAAARVQRQERRQREEESDIDDGPFSEDDMDPFEYRNTDKYRDGTTFHDDDGVCRFGHYVNGRGWEAY